MKRFLPRLFAAALAGCAAPATHWEKPGATERMAQEALEECRTQARLSPAPRVATGLARPGTTGAIDRLEERDSRAAEQLRRCMGEKGFRAQTR